ncbi:MAG: RNA polymerase sigma factor [Acidimicrobiia bacterium]
MPKGATTERVSDVDPGVLERARAGDQRAFRAIVSHYDRGLRALAFRLLGDAGHMDDVLQEVYVKAYRGMAGFRGDASAGTWLYRVTYNACLDHLRRSKRADVVPFEGLAERASADPDPGERAAVRGSLSDALSALSPEQRAVVMLVDAEGFDHASAARILGVAEGTVHSRLFRAHAILRERLGRKGGER